MNRVKPFTLRRTLATATAAALSFAARCSQKPLELPRTTHPLLK